MLLLTTRPAVRRSSIWTFGSGVAHKLIKLIKLIMLIKLIKLTWTPHVVVLEAALESCAVRDADDAQTLPHAPRKLPLVHRQRCARLQGEERPDMYASCTCPRLRQHGIRLQGAPQ